MSTTKVTTNSSGWGFVDRIWAEEGGVQVLIHEHASGEKRIIICHGNGETYATLATYRCERLIKALQKTDEEGEG